VKIITVVGVFGLRKIEHHVPTNEASPEVRVKGQFETPRVLVKSRRCTVSLENAFPLWSELTIAKPCLDRVQISENECDRLVYGLEALSRPGHISCLNSNQYFAAISATYTSLQVSSIGRYGLQLGTCRSYGRSSLHVFQQLAPEVA
jgi:hypothetical protein